MRKLELSMVAGETSGDLLGGLLLGALRERWPNLVSNGIGGPKMRALDFDAWWPHEKLAVRGYFEVLRHYREIAGIRRQLAQRLLANPPSAFIGVDAPDFNFGLETTLKAAGIKTIHFVCPSIWAWRGKRVLKMRDACDHVLCLFPFEPALLHEHGVAATFVGHPLADTIPIEPPRVASRTALGLAEQDTVIALLPGSRRSEIQYIAESFIAAAAILHRQNPHWRFVLPVVPGLRSMLEPMLARHTVPIQVLDGQSHEALAACDLTLIASGTATLEAALFKRPMVIGYKMHALSWQMMKRMGYQPWVGLPNILSREFVVPELLQSQCTPENLAREASKFLADDARRASAAQRFAAIHHQLRCDTARTATHAIEKILA